jgi:hypothetical protein
MSYVTHDELRKFVADWEFRSLQSKVNQMESKERLLQEEISYLQQKVRNHYSAIEQLLQIIIDNNLLPGNENILYQIRQYL